VLEHYHEEDVVEGRVTKVVTFGAFAHIPAQAGEALFARWAEHWGTPETLTVELVVPEKVGNPEFLRWMNRFERQCTAPSGVLGAWRWIRETDLRPVLGSIQCPTLVMHRTGDRLAPVQLGQRLAHGIPDATLAELDALLASARERGWAAEDGDVTPEYASVGAAAFDRNDYPAAAIGVTFLRAAVDDATRDKLTAATVAAATALTSRLTGRS